jgi:hypothetical protein
MNDAEIIRELKELCAIALMVINEECPCPGDYEDLKYRLEDASKDWEPWKPDEVIGGENDHERR